MKAMEVNIIAAISEMQGEMVAALELLMELRLGQKQQAPTLSRLQPELLTPAVVNYQMMQCASPGASPSGLTSDVPSCQLIKDTNCHLPSSEIQWEHLRVPDVNLLTESKIHTFAFKLATKSKGYGAVHSYGVCCFQGLTCCRTI